jgi:hypothetical protein
MGRLLTFYQLPHLSFPERMPRNCPNLAIFLNNQDTDRIRLTSKQIETLRSLPDAKIQAAFLLLTQVSPQVLNEATRLAEEEYALRAAGNPIALAELERSKMFAAIHGPREVWLSESQISALASLPTPHLRKTLLLMRSVRQEDLEGLILHAQYGVELEKAELKRLMEDGAAYDEGRHTSQDPAQQDNDDADV